MFSERFMVSPRIGYFSAHDPNSLEILWKNDFAGTGTAWGGSILPYVTPISKTQIIICGFNSYVVAVNAATGENMWRVSVGFTRSFMCTLISSYGGQDVLWAAGNGYLYAIDPTTGKELCTDELKGFGYHKITLATTTFRQNQQCSPLLIVYELEAEASQTNTIL